MSTTNRRYDIDWLRVIAIGLLLIYHISIVFQPWGAFIGFIPSDEPWEALWVPMAMLNVWRIPLLFFVSGMGVCFAMQQRSWKQLLAERTRRILVPFLFGAFTIVPLHLLIWQRYYGQTPSYAPHPAHLWFLGNIFCYVLLLLPVFFYLKGKPQGVISRRLTALFGSPWGLVVVIGAFELEVLIMQPMIFEMYTMTWHGFVLGLLAFFFGFCFVYSGEAFWSTMLRGRWLFLGAALALYLVRLLVFELRVPGYFMAIESNLWIFAVLGFAYRYLNRPGRLLNYLSQGAYPIYILHMVFLYLGCWLILPLSLPVAVEFALIVGITGVGCLAVYDLLIKRIGVLRPLFGLKRR